MGLRTKMLFEAVLDDGGAFVGIVEGKRAVHSYVCLDSYAVADAASAQVVRLTYIGA